MLVKICGITRLEDATAAVALGAHALGFVFWPESPRRVDPGLARSIIAALPPFVTPVGVFVNQSSEYVNLVAAVAGLGAVQLHGDESPAFADAMVRPVIKAVTTGRSGEEPAVGAWPPRVTLLLDVHDRARRGGTGQRVDWDVAARLVRERRCVLAGGLDAGNVGEAIARVRPFGIDVSSGVERSPGVKDHDRLRALFEAVATSTSGA
jgi:phosphoribosylanthranilate isomerase